MLNEADYSFISQHQLAHTSIHSRLERQIPRLSKAVPKLSFDFSQSWDREYLLKILPWIDVAILSYPTLNNIQVCKNPDRFIDNRAIIKRSPDMLLAAFLVFVVLAIPPIDLFLAAPVTQ